jgi:hypothetical protein
MRYVLAKSTRHLMWKIRTLALSGGIVLVSGSTPVFARGGGHSGGGHGGGHSGGHGGHSGGQRGHHGGHTGNTHWTDYKRHNGEGPFHEPASLSLY